MARLMSGMALNNSASLEWRPSKPVAAPGAAQAFVRCRHARCFRQVYWPEPIHLTDQPRSVQALPYGQEEAAEEADSVYTFAR
jgi:hypothetical protein